MKRQISAVWIAFVVLLSALQLSAQVHKTSGIPGSGITPADLEVTFSKTTNLIFPYAIKSVDKGSKDLLVQVASGVENILQVKAAKQGFMETNLTVVTGEGKLYSYNVRYADYPSQLNFKVAGPVRGIDPDAFFAAAGDNDAKIRDLSEQLALRKAIMRGPKDKNSGVSLKLEGIYIGSEMLYFQFGLENSSQVNYDVNQFRFYLRDKGQAKRTASQQQEIEPLRYAGNVALIRGRSGQHIVAVLPKFTIPDKKNLYVELMEQHGGRNLSLKIKNKDLVKAHSIPEQ